MTDINPEDLKLGLDIINKTLESASSEIAWIDKEVQEHNEALMDLMERHTDAEIRARQAGVALRVLLEARNAAQPELLRFAPSVDPSDPAGLRDQPEEEDGENRD